MHFRLLILFMFISPFVNAQSCHWAFALGGASATSPDVCNSVYVDGSGNTLVTGQFSGTADFDPGPGIASFSAIGTGNRDIFIAKYNRYGDYLWAFQIGNSFADQGYAITQDDSGYIYVTGNFQGNNVDFDPSPATAYISGFSRTAFIAKYSPAGAYIWAFEMESSSSGSSGYAIATDASRNVIVTGYFGASTDFDPGPGTANLYPVGATDAFVAKYTTNGIYQWAFKIGGSFGVGDEGHGVGVDTSDNIFVTGFFNEQSDFDPSPNTVMRYSGGGFDAYLAKYDKNGNYKWVNTFWSSTDGKGSALTVDPVGNCYVSGQFNQYVNFDSLSTTIILISNGMMDGFVAKYDSSGKYQWAFNLGANYADYATGIALDTSGFFYVTGNYYASSIDMNPGMANYLLPNSGKYDVYIAKYDTGGTFVWANKIGGSEDDYANGIAVSPSGDCYVSGSFTGTNVGFDSGSANMHLTSAGFNDAFFAKYTTCIPFSVSIGGNTSICAGANTTLVASGGQSYQWMPGNFSADSILVAPVNSTIYTVEGRDSLNCKATASATIQVIAKPSVTISGSSTIYSGNSTLLTANGANAYLWYPSAGLSIDSGLVTAASPTSNVNYCVIGTKGNCSDTACIYITVLPNAIQELNTEETVHVIPNPFSTQAIFYFEANLKDATLCVYNAAGSLVKKLDIPSGNSVLLNQDNLSEGLYFYTLFQYTQPPLTGRFAIVEE